MVVCGTWVAGALVARCAPPALPGAQETPAKVDVAPHVKDDQIKERLTRILQATHWFEGPRVEVDEGVVFLQGNSTSEESKQWAGALAGKTEDVVAVVNQIEVVKRPAFKQIEELSEAAIRFSPFAVLAAGVLVLTWFASKLTIRASAKVLQRRLRNNLLVEVGSRTLAIPVFLCGVYIVLQICGLTKIALTVAGGTGLAGLVIGIAFRDILENFLASILISIQHPFLAGDLIQVEDKIGFVQRVTTRGTVLIAYDGTYIQVPNATIYKSTIHNFTANPKMRQEFVVGIGLMDPVDVAQEVAAKVLREHPAILQDPEPIVLVDAIVGGNVNLKVYFWVDARLYSDLKVRSSAIRLVKAALQEAKMLSPDGIQSVAFPKGVAVQLVAAAAQGRSEASLPTPFDKAAPTARREAAQPPQAPAARRANKSTPVATAAEGGLESDVEDLHAQAAEAPLPNQGEDLLVASNGRPSDGDTAQGSERP
jgi:small-conductance mechanosensitive channel